MPMQKIIPNLWFVKEAKEAAAFYTSLFLDCEDQAEIDHVTQALLPMKKFDLAKLREAFAG